MPGPSPRIADPLDAAYAEAMGAVWAAHPEDSDVGVLYAEALLDGEILYRAGEHDQGFARLREAVDREDALRYDEPPDWIQPVRHPLGAALLQSGKYEEAEAVFRRDLERLPGNGWSLFGMGRALRLQGKDAEAAGHEARFEEAWKSADVKISSPCFCQSGV